jgi:ribosomal protein S18 acetylase RimI-like enzyme
MDIDELISKSLSTFDKYYALKNVNCSKVLVAKVNGKDVGFAELKRRKNIGAIFYLGVLPGYRGKGIGKDMVRRAEKYFKAKGLSLVVASTRSWNIAAVRMFSSLGYKIIKKEKVQKFIIELLDATEDNLILCKELGHSSCDEIKRK